VPMQVRTFRAAAGVWNLDVQLLVAPTN
jgi:hypothetical protein